jgi:hypothetical protein
VTRAVLPVKSTTLMTISPWFVEFATHPLWAVPDQCNREGVVPPLST